MIAGGKTKKQLPIRSSNENSAWIVGEVFVKCPFCGMEHGEIKLVSLENTSIQMVYVTMFHCYDRL